MPAFFFFVVLAAVPGGKSFVFTDCLRMRQNIRVFYRWKKGEFSKDIEELSFNQIPLLDRDSATLLGNRKMGSMVDMVSRFEADDTVQSD